MCKLHKMRKDCILYLTYIESNYHLNTRCFRNSKNGSKKPFPSNGVETETKRKDLLRDIPHCHLFMFMKKDFWH